MGSRLGRRVMVTLLALYLLAILVLMAAPNILGDDFEEGVSLDNRTDQELVLFVLLGPADDPGEARIGTVAAHRHVGFGVGGCSERGLEARNADGDVVAGLPPMDPQDELGCDFTWVVTPSGDRIEP